MCVCGRVPFRHSSAKPKPARCLVMGVGEGGRRAFDLIFFISQVLRTTAREREVSCPSWPEHEMQVTWRASVCCQVAAFVGQPLSRHRAIGSWTKPWSRRGWAKLRWLPPDVRVSCQVVTIAPQRPRRQCGLPRHRASRSWTSAWPRRRWAKLRWSHPDVRVACSQGHRVVGQPLSRHRAISCENKVTSALSRRSWPRTVGRTLVQTAGCGSSVCQPAERSTERGGKR